MIITADSLKPHLGKTMFLLFLALELARRKQSVLFLSASERTDSYLGIESLRGQETWLLDKEYEGRIPGISSYLYKPVPFLSYFAAPKSRKLCFADISSLLGHLDYQVVVSQYFSPNNLSFYLYPPNINIFKEKDTVYQTASCYRIITGMTEELLTEERKTIYRSLFDSEPLFLHWDPRLSLIPFERSLLDYFNNEYQSLYLQGIREAADLYVPGTKIRETSGTGGFWRKWLGSIRNE